MRKQVSVLTAIAARSAKPKEKPYRLAAGGGLYLEVQPNGAKYWRWKYRFAGKEKRLALGVFPEVSLAEAGARRDQARAQLRDGTDPSLQRKLTRRAERIAAANSLDAVAREWLAKQRKALADVTHRKAEWMLLDLLPATLLARPIASIDPPDILDALRPIEAKGNLETAHRVKQRLSQVFRYAIATSRALRDPCADLRGALAPVVSQSRAAITDPAQIGQLLRAIEGFSGQPATHAALRLSPLVFVRPGELRAMEWNEVNLDAAEWRIPAARMKMRDEHIVPLSTQAVAILRDLHALTGGFRFAFPSLRSPNRPMSENTVNAALRRLGYATDEMTGHGFRALASTRLNEMGWPPDVIERQLAHAERNKVRAAYNRAQHLAERRRMMQAWSDTLDQLRDGAAIIPLRHGAA